jgi:hypothetical protein
MKRMEINKQKGQSQKKLVLMDSHVLVVRKTRRGTYWRMFARV